MNMVFSLVPCGYIITNIKRFPKEMTNYIIPQGVLCLAAAIYIPRTSSVYFKVDLGFILLFLVKSYISARSTF